jgi:hypothetical protein
VEVAFFGSRASGALQGLVGDRKYIRESSGTVAALLGWAKRQGAVRGVTWAERQGEQFK